MLYTLYNCSHLYVYFKPFINAFVLASRSIPSIHRSWLPVFSLRSYNDAKVILLVFSPIPLMLSSSERVWLLLRLSLWKVMAKRVHFVLYLCKETEHLALYRHTDRNGREAEKKFGYPVLSVFRQSGYRYVEMEFVLYDFPDNFHLPLSTVGKDQVGQGRTFVYGSLVTAAYHLFHGCVIIEIDHCLDNVFAVIFL